jgi:hypothetical protein
MALTIVWRTLLSLVRFTRILQLIITSELGAAHAVTASDLRLEYRAKVPELGCLIPVPCEGRC